MSVMPNAPVTHLTPPPAPTPPTPPTSSLPTPRDVYALLRTAPKGQAHVAPTLTPAPNVATAQAPDTVQPPRTKNATLDRIRTLTSQESVTKMLREPRSQETAQRLTELRSLLRQESARALQSGPDQQEATKTLSEVQQQLSLLNLQVQQKIAANEHNPELTPDRIRERTRSNDPDESYNSGIQVKHDIRLEEALTELRIQRSAAVVNALAEIGQSLKVDAHGPQPPATPPARSDSAHAPAQQVYAFRDTGESTLAAPREVLNFAHGKDRLDVSGIRARQGNEPLKLVEHFSGAKGEMQIHYLPGTHTSVVMICGEPGTPPFVLKVFGEVTFSDLIT